jgi:hypothetical protein
MTDNLKHTKQTDASWLQFSPNYTKLASINIKSISLMH